MKNTQILIISLIIILTACTKEREKSSKNDIVDFYFPNRQYEIKIETNEIIVYMQDTQPVDQMIPVIKVSQHAWVSPASHVARDFTKDVAYTVTAENGNKKEYTVKVRRNSDNALISFSIPNQTCDVHIEGSKVTVDVYRFIDITKLTPIVVVSQGAAVDPPSGSTVDFTEAVTYTVTAMDGSVAKYTVTVNKNLSRRNDIEKFELIGTEQIFEREGDDLFIYVPYETDVTNIETYIVVSDMAAVSPASGTFVDFTNPQIYTVTASDGTSKNYLVTVKRSPWRKVGNGPFSPRDEHTVLVYDGKMWLLGGWIGGETHVTEVWNSSDGTNWNLVTDDAPWKNKKSTNFVVFKEKIYALGGVGEDLGVYSSVDGLNWYKIIDEVPWGKRYHPYIAVFKDKIWVIGGLEIGFTQPRPYGVEVYSDVWSSDDGVSWTMEKPYLQFPARGLVHGYAVLEDELYIYSGGSKGTVILSETLETLSEYNDVWKTSDGLNWVRITNTPGWPPRTHSSITVYQKKLYLLAGSIRSQAQDNLSNEVWKSTDGSNWEQVRHSFFSPRHAASAVEFKGKLFLVAGFLLNDIWVLENY